ncbi:hypothetical protein HDU86_004869 [Geranomyces michiganensis]|nr:hypothetical protein HDU86_004869 [Geranomyces michiganensis]
MHLSSHHLAAVRVNGNLERNGLLAIYERGGVGNDANILRKAAGSYIRKATMGARPKDGGHFYAIERTDLQEIVWKFGLDKVESDNDDVDQRIQNHEGGACHVEIDKHITSAFIPDASRFDHVINLFLAPARVAFGEPDIQCPCRVQHQEYYRGNWALVMGLAVWKWAADNAATNFFV